MDCPDCERMMQELFTQSSMTGNYARVGYLCPWCGIIIIDDWDEHGDHIGRLTPMESDGCPQGAFRGVE